MTVNDIGSEASIDGNKDAVLGSTPTGVADNPQDDDGER